MTRLEALKEAEALVARLAPEKPAPMGNRYEKPVEASLGDRVSQILRVADYLTRTPEEES